MNYYYKHEMYGRGMTQPVLETAQTGTKIYHRPFYFTIKQQLNISFANLFTVLV